MCDMLMAVTVPPPLTAWLEPKAFGSDPLLGIGLHIWLINHLTTLSLFPTLIFTVISCRSV